MSNLIVILGDQLNLAISSLNGVNKEKDIILLAEVWQEASYVQHHKKKIAFIFSAMRHFAKELLAAGYFVHYTKFKNKKDNFSFKEEIRKLKEIKCIDKIIITYPGEYRVLKDINSWQADLGIEVEIRPDDRFLATLDEFKSWAKGKNNLRMENFYRQMRKKHNILMNNDKPVGGRWNFDIENRKPAKETLKPPNHYINPQDQITKEVLKLVAQNFHNHFGDLEPFYFAVTRQQALAALDLFIHERLENFGTFQDAMLENEPWMYHSHISFYLNCGLLLPKECIAAVEKAYHNQQIPLNSAEGFIRQILGWREYIRGVYWLKMPEYKEYNFFNATKKLPEFYWTGQTSMNCIKQCIKETKENAYAHHIQRLMVLGNFALIAAIDPKAVQEWFLSVYADAYEWVELPNVSGMILFADGGFLASKPYASGGTYINKMSNYCKGCKYKVSLKQGPSACPFNYLYWNFLSTQRELLKNNHRLAMLYKVYDRMSKEKKDNIQKDSVNFLKSI
jgi:deoxyribodipyrimidine photolyase-related protein